MAPPSRKSNELTIRLLNNNQNFEDPPDLLQFACGEYFCVEGDSYIDIKVERLGNPDGEASVEYYTVNGSALAGKKYKADSGVLNFASEETEAVIRIELIEDNSFDSVVEFEVHLKNAKGAVLDDYLNKCEITIADDDRFPTNKYKADIDKADYSHISAHHMMMEYLKMHMQDRKLFRAALLTVITDQLENLEMILNVYLTRYLINNILTTAKTGKPPAEFLEDISPQVQMYGLVAFFFLPVPIKFFLQHMKASRRMGGKARTRLQQNLLRKYLNYSEVSRSNMANADVIMAVTRDVPQVVRDGLMEMFPLCQKISLVAMYGALAIFQTPEASSVVFFCAFPILMLMFLKAREKNTDRIAKELFSAQTKLVTFMQKVTDFFRMVADYGQKQETVGTFNGVVKNFNDRNHAYTTRQITNKIFAPLLTNIIIGLYMLIFWERVLDTDSAYGVGDFVAGLTIWRGVGACYQGMYEDVLTMHDAVSCLHNILYYMNLPLDIGDKAVSKNIMLRELDKAQDAACALFYLDEPAECPLVQPGPNIISGDIVERAVYSQDLIQIDFENVQFAWPAQGDRAEKRILDGATFEICQGALVGLIGSTGCGKGTLLQLLGGILVPKEGSGLCFVPPHLRLLHVSTQPVIFHDTNLWGNLLYGDVSKEDSNPDRVIQICKRLGISDDILGQLKSSRPDEQEADWKPSVSHVGTGASVATRCDAAQKAVAVASISHNDRCLLHLARALVVNPDVLIMHKPLTNFHGTQIHRVVEVLRDFVDLRGLEKKVELRRQRRPRTCIMSCASLENIEIFDSVFQLQNGKVEQVNLGAIAQMEKETRAMLASLDGNGDGVVTQQEFIAELKTRPEIAKLFDISPEQLKAPDIDKQLGEEFLKVDYNGVGMISTEDLWHCMAQQVQNHIPTHDGSNQEKRQKAGSLNSARGLESARARGVSVSDIEREVWVPDEGGAPLEDAPAEGPPSPNRRLPCIPVGSIGLSPGRTGEAVSLVPSAAHDQSLLTWTP